MEFDIYRMFFVFISGYFLSVSGSLSQLITNNTMASPSTLGMDGVAVLTIIMAQAFITWIYPEADLSGFSFGLFLFLLMTIGVFIYFRNTSSEKVWHVTSVKKIILLGLSFNLFIGAIFSVLMFLFMALNYEFPSGIWFGSFKQFQPEWLWIFLAIFGFIVMYIKLQGKKLALLNLGESFVIGMNVDVKRLHQQSLFIIFLLTGGVICFFGVFSFLGLIFPHILRSLSLFKTDMYKELTLGPILAGAILLVIDLFCYNLTFMGAELPVGMVSGVIGSFFLIFLIIRAKV